MTTIDLREFGRSQAQAHGRTLREALLKWTLRESMRRDPPPKTPPARPAPSSDAMKGPRRE